jgi:hypothetical protein
MLLHGPSCGHDFDFHLLNWLEVNTQLHHLTWPRWAYTPAYNAGEPRFLFYPPLSWLLGAALTQVLPFPLVPIAFTFVALTLSGLTLRRCAAPYAPPAAATVASILYLLNPYMLFTAYERTAYAELLAAAFLPLLFAAILTPRPTIPHIALPIALLWLTNAPAAVMGSYALAVLTLLRLILGTPSFQLLRGGAIHEPTPAVLPLPSSLSPRPWSLALTSALGTALGLALAAFYILPAAYERRFVQISMAVIPGMAPADNTLFHHMSLSPGISAHDALAQDSLAQDALAHDIVLHTASVVACILLALTAATLLASLLRSSRNPTLLASGSAAEEPAGIAHQSHPPSSLLPLPSSLLCILTVVLALLLTPASLPIWRHLPELAFLQFPWRLLALLAPILALATAGALSRLRPPFTLALAPILAAILIPSAWHTFQQPCDLPDTPQARAALFHSPLGTEPTDEYTPTDADPDALHPEDPPYWLLPPSSPIDTPAPANAAPGPVSNHLTLTLPTPETIVLNRRAYPLWRIQLNHHPVQPLAQRTDGLIALALPAGPDTLDLTLAQSPEELAGDLLSILAALTLATLTLTLRHARPVTPQAAPLS